MEQNLRGVFNTGRNCGMSLCTLKEHTLKVNTLLSLLVQYL